ncbi:MAG: hypothetical protein JJT78_14525 [Leptospira sp.]|nr:hypothetical protein [Leptospira sp.]
MENIPKLATCFYLIFGKYLSYATASTSDSFISKSHLAKSELGISPIWKNPTPIPFTSGKYNKTKV